MKILILAADGGYKEWKEDYPRQLVKIAGEPLLIRVLIELAERGHLATVVTDIPEIIEIVPDSFFVPAKTDTIFDTILSTRELWEGTILILLGDVFMTQSFYDIILNYEGESTCFDSIALVFNEEDYDRTIEALEELANQPCEAFFNRLWIDEHFPMIDIGKHTDFDIVPYYKKFLEANPWAKSIS